MTDPQSTYITGPTAYGANDDPYGYGRPVPARDVVSIARRAVIALSVQRLPYSTPPPGEAESPGVAHCYCVVAIATNGLPCVVTPLFDTLDEANEYVADDPENYLS